MPKLSLAKLERHLYAAADLLRQEGLDAATYKDYIFGMLFLKRCSDVFEAEHDDIVDRKIEQGMVRDEAEKKYGENPDYYDGFFVPERARWHYLQQQLNDATKPFGSVPRQGAGRAQRGQQLAGTRAGSHQLHADPGQQAHRLRRGLQGSWSATSRGTACATRTFSFPTCWARPTNS